MSYEDISAEFERIVRRHHLSYQQFNDVLKITRRNVGLKKTRKGRGTTIRLSSEEEERFIATAYRQDGIRGLMLTTLLETGTRVSEFCNLAVDDVSFDERLITIRHGKGDKRREVPIREDLARLLQIHIGGREVGYLFESRRHDKFGVRRMQQIVKEVATAAGITKNVHPHLLRHTIATRLINSGMPLDQVQMFLGHNDPKTTQIYARTETTTLRKGFDAAMK